MSIALTLPAGTRRITLTSDCVPRTSGDAVADAFHKQGVETSGFDFIARSSAIGTGLFTVKIVQVTEERLLECPTRRRSRSAE